MKDILSSPQDYPVLWMETLLRNQDQAGGVDCKDLRYPSQPSSSPISDPALTPPTANPLVGPPSLRAGPHIGPHSLWASPSAASPGGPYSNYLMAQSNYFMSGHNYPPSSYGGYSSITASQSCSSIYSLVPANQSGISIYSSPFSGQSPPSLFSSNQSPHSLYSSSSPNQLTPSTYSSPNQSPPSLCSPPPSGQSSPVIDSFGLSDLGGAATFTETSKYAYGHIGTTDGRIGDGGRNQQCSPMDDSSAQIYFDRPNYSPSPEFTQTDNSYSPVGTNNPLNKQFCIPPISIKESDTFTSAELKAITPWRDELIRRLLLAHSRKLMAAPARNGMAADTSKKAGASADCQAVNSMVQRQAERRQREGKGNKVDRVKRYKSRRSGTVFRTQVLHEVCELNFGFGPGFSGSMQRGTPEFAEILQTIDQVNSGCGSVRTLVETILTMSLPRHIAEYSLTGKALHRKLEIRNGEETQRVIMSDIGVSKLGVPAALVQGIARFLESILINQDSAAGSNLLSYTRKLISKTCSRCQERRFKDTIQKM